MGGWTAVEYALTRPAALKALVLAGTTGTIDPQKIAEPERTRLAPGSRTSSRRCRACSRAASTRRPANAWRANNRRSTFSTATSTIKTRASTKQPLGAALDVRARHAPPEDLRAVACPILFVSGDEDIVIPPFAADAIARTVPGAKVAHIEDAGHSAYFERAERFNRIVDDFLEGTP